MHGFALTKESVGSNIPNVKKKKRCTKIRGIRNGTWLTRVEAPLVTILEAIYFWVSGQTYKTIRKWTGLNGPQVWKISRCCRLVAAKFMLANPHLNCIGGQDKHGKPIVCQIDETHCGKMKYHRGKPRVSTWVLGGIESKADTDPKQKASRMGRHDCP